MNKIECIINYTYLESDYFKSLQQKEADRFTGALIIDDPHKHVKYSRSCIDNAINAFIKIPSNYINNIPSVRVKIDD